MDGALAFLVVFGVLVLVSCIRRDQRTNNRVANRPLQGQMRIGMHLVPRDPEDKP